MATTNGNRPILDLGRTEFCAPAPIATVGGSFIASSRHFRQQQLYVYGIWNQEEGILGATPETLFHTSGKMVQTMALAGTAMKTSENRPLDLLKDAKEMKEHRLVVEDIQKQLTPLGWVKTLPTEVAEFPMLYHLKTEIAVEAAQISVPQLVRSLHPTAALGVFPRNYGIQWMANLPYQKTRGLFGAPIVYSLSHNEFLGLVAIRNLIWGAEGSKIGSGGGLIDSSVFEKEWAELKLKRDSVFYSLGIS
jgi:menaquinone-specific isochorismate synthase